MSVARKCIDDSLSQDVDEKVFTFLLINHLWPQTGYIIHLKIGTVESSRPTSLKLLPRGGSRG